MPIFAADLCINLLMRQIQKNKNSDIKNDLIKVVYGYFVIIIWVICNF